MQWLSFMRVLTIGTSVFLFRTRQSQTPSIIRNIDFFPCNTMLTVLLSNRWVSHTQSHSGCKQCNKYYLWYYLLKYATDKTVIFCKCVCVSLMTVMCECDLLARVTCNQIHGTKKIGTAKPFQNELVDHYTLLLIKHIAISATFCLDMTQNMKVKYLAFGRIYRSWYSASAE